MADLIPFASFGAVQPQQQDPTISGGLFDPYNQWAYGQAVSPAGQIARNLGQFPNKMGQAVDTGASALKYFFTGQPLTKEEQWGYYPQGQQGQPQPQAPSALPFEPPKRNTNSGRTEIDVPKMDYTAGLPQMQYNPLGIDLRPAGGGGAPRVPNIPAGTFPVPEMPNNQQTLQRMRAAAPGPLADQSWSTKDEDAWMYILKGLAQGGLASRPDGSVDFGRSLLQLALGGLGGAVEHKGVQRREAKEYSAQEREYQMWLASNENQLEQQTFNAAMARAGYGLNMEQAKTQQANTQFSQQMAAAQLNQQGAAQAANYNLNLAQLMAQQQMLQSETQFKNASAMYEAQLRNAERQMPKVSGDNLIQLTPDGKMIIQNMNPLRDMLSSGGMPIGGGDYTVPGLSANLMNVSPEYGAKITQRMAKLASDPTILQMTAGLGGEKMAGPLVINQLQNQLMQEAQLPDPVKAAEARAMLSVVQQSLALGAMSDKLGKVK